MLPLRAIVAVFRAIFTITTDLMVDGLHHRYARRAA